MYLCAIIYSVNSFFTGLFNATTNTKSTEYSSLFTQNSDNGVEFIKLKCGEGKCGTSDEKASEKKTETKEMKCGEGKCGK